MFIAQSLWYFVFQLYEEMEVYLSTMGPVLDSIDRLYTDKDLNDDKKVWISLTLGFSISFSTF